MNNIGQRFIVLRMTRITLICLTLLLASNCLAQYSITVKKSERKLILFKDGKEVKTYPMALGSSPTGHKMANGDRKTPEGEYSICRKNPKSQFYLSLGLNYPNRQDAAQGVRSGLISRKQYRNIIRALDLGDCPPWDTSLGGEIFIHGNGSKTDWTWGCVALDDPQMKELYELVPVGTKVTISP
jgi:murein L,D-transpeptidase YafK